MRNLLVATVATLLLTTPAIAQGKSDLKSQPNALSDKKPGQTCEAMKTGTQAHKDCMAAQSHMGQKSKDMPKMDKGQGRKSGG